MLTPVLDTKIAHTVPKPEGGARSDEVVVFCPGCKAFQTVWFTNGNMMPTRKFRLQGGQIYHDCGSRAPCRLYNS